MARQSFDPRRIFYPSRPNITQIFQKPGSRATREVSREWRKGYILVRDKVTGPCWEARDYNRVLVQFDDVSITVPAEPGTRDQEVVGSEGAIPVGEEGAKLGDST